ncbi:MAG: DUF4178 domain-containing protein [Pseudomonadota bacterium]
MSIRNQAKRRKQLANRKTAIRGLTPLPEAERFNYDLTQLKSNAYLRFNQKVYLVEGTSRYQEHNWKLTKAKKFQSFELDLFCLNNAERINIEWEKDDRIEVFITTDEIKLSSLCDEENVNIGSEDLEQIVDDEDSVFLNGKEFEYDDDWAARYYRDSESKNDVPLDEGVPVRFYEFIASDGSCLTIEEWLDGEPNDTDTEFEYEVFLSQPLDAEIIEILSPGN